MKLLIERSLAKSFLNNILTTLIFHEKPLKVSFSIAWLREQLVRLNSIVFVVFTDYRNTSNSPYSYSSYYYYYSELIIYEIFLYIWLCN